MKFLLNMLCVCSLSLCCASASDSSTNASTGLSMEDFKSLHIRANKALEEENYAGAAKIFEQLLPHSKPKSIFAWQTHEILGAIYLNIKEYKQAEKHLIAFTDLCFEHPETLESIQSRVAKALTYLGHAQKEQDKHKEALKSYKSALHHEPGLLESDAFLVAGLASCYISINKTEKAQELLNNLLI